MTVTPELEAKVDAGNGTPEENQAVQDYRMRMALARQRPATFEGQRSKDKTQYAVRNMVEIAKLELATQTFLWNGIAHTPFAICGIAGSPGIGKSRFVADLARHVILGWDFAGLHTNGKGKKWLFVGSENGIHRLTTEARRFFLGANADNFAEKVQELMAARKAAEANPSEQNVAAFNVKRNEVDPLFYEFAKENGLTDRDILELATNFLTFTLENPEDCYISLSDEENVRKLTATLAAVRPDVIVFDPWGDLIDGSELDDGDVRRTCQKARKCAADANIQPQIIIISHARMGIKEEASARGHDAGNFMKNSKALYSISRVFFNIRRASFDENPPIEVICSKNNDGVKPPPVALELDQQTMSYRHIEDWDADKWQAELEGKARQRGTESAEAKLPEKVAEENAAAQRAFLDAAVQVANAAGDNLLTTTDFQQNLLKTKGGAVAKSTGSAKFRDLWRLATGEQGVLKSQRAQERKPNGTIGNTKERREYVSTPDRIATYLKQFEVLGI